ncbi:MAG: phosphoglycerate transporter [Chloroflexi bacterium]|nr:phosphoglycerate transporter [Chloroflexota bacterium]
MNDIRRIGWLSTGRDEAARDLLRVVRSAMDTGDISGRLEFVFCNREPGESAESDRFIELVNGYTIPLVCLSGRRFWREHGAGEPYAGAAPPPWRLRYDEEVLRLLSGFPHDLVVMAGYMMITSPLLCQQMTMINLHPALPNGPKGTWQEVVWQVIEAQAPASGVMMHLVTPELDRGPAIAYCAYSLRGEEMDPLWRQAGDRTGTGLQAAGGESLPLFQAVRRRGLAREFPLIVATIKAFGEGRFRVESGQVVDERGQPRPPVDLTAEVEAALRGAGVP